MIFLRLLILFPAYTVGAVLIAILCARFFLVPADRRRTEILLAATLLTLVLASFALSFAKFESSLRPLKDDLYIAWLGSYLGAPSFALGRLVQPHLWLQLILMFAYDLLPVAVIAVFAACLYRAPSTLPHVVRAFALSLLLAPLFYFLVPVCGPLYAFPHFPQSPVGPIAPHLLRLSAPPNGVPSVHTSTALLILWFSRRWKIGSLLASVYLVLILFSTLASGEHYLIDLIAAVPYTALVLWLTRRYEHWSASRPHSPRESLPFEAPQAVDHALPH